MKRIFEYFFITLFLLAFASPAQAMGTIRVVIYGDSLTSGYQLTEADSYASKLSAKLKAIGYTNVEVVNMSVAGETTAGGLERLSSLLVKQPDIVVVELGGNDVIRGVNPNVIYQNLMHIIGRLKENNTYVVLMGMQAPSNMGTSYSQQVENLYQRIATFYSLAFHPFALEGIFGNPELNLADGYHPNAKGIEVMVENTYRLVDAGLRWKWDYLQYQEEYQRRWKEDVAVPAQSSSAMPAGSSSMNQYTPQPVPADPNAAMPPPQ